MADKRAKAGFDVGAYYLQMHDFHSADIYDQTLDYGVLLEALKRKGAFRSISNESDLKVTVKHAKIQHQMYPERGAAPIVAATDRLTDAVFQLKNGMFGTTIYKKDGIFTGKERMLDLWEEFRKELVSDSATAIEYEILKGQGGDSQEGLEMVINSTPAAGTLGGIARSNDWWQSQYIDFTSFDPTTSLIKKMNKMYDDCSDEAKKGPDIIITTDEIGRLYADTGFAKSYTELGAKKFELGYKDDMLFFRDAQVLKLKRAAPGEMRFLTSDALEVVHPVNDFMKEQGIFMDKTRPGDKYIAYTFSISIKFKQLYKQGLIDNIVLV